MKVLEAVLIFRKILWYTHHSRKGKCFFHKWWWYHRVWNHRPWGTFHFAQDTFLFWGNFFQLEVRCFTFSIRSFGLSYLRGRIALWLYGFFRFRGCFRQPTPWSTHKISVRVCQDGPNQVDTVGKYLCWYFWGWSVREWLTSMVGWHWWVRCIRVGVVMGIGWVRYC